MSKDKKLSSKLLRSGAIVSVMTLVSRVLGLVRDIVVGALLGTSATADVYFFAAKIPNFMRRLFAEGAFAQAFVPVLSEVQTNGTKDEVRQLIARVSGTLGLIVTLVTVVGVIASPVLALLFGTGWFVDWLNGEPDGVKFELASVMLKITFPYLWFISLTALSGAILNAYGRFAVSSFTPVFLNVAIISAALWLAPQFEQPGVGLAWGWLLGGMLQLGFQLPFLYRSGLLVRPRWGWSDPGVVKIRTLMIPALFGVSVSQINLLFDTFIASFLITGSVSWLFFSDRLLEFPLGLFGIAIATVLLPTLSRRHAEQSDTAFKAAMDWAVRMVLMMGVPAMLGLAVLAMPLLTVLFVRGEFSAESAQMSAYSLMAYATGLLSFMLIKVLAPGFYARQDTKTPVKIGIRAMLINMVFNAILAGSLGYEYGYIGLALATSLSAACNAWWLYRGLRKADVYRFSSLTKAFALKVLFAGVAMAGLIVWLDPAPQQWLTMSLSGQLQQLFMLIFAGAGCYFSLLWLLGIRPGQLKPQADENKS